MPIPIPCFYCSAASRLCSCLRFAASVYYVVVINGSMISRWIIAFVAMRIMALWSRNWVIGVFLFVLGLFNPSAIQEVLMSVYSVPRFHPSDRCAVSLFFSASSVVRLRSGRWEDAFKVRRRQLRRPTSSSTSSHCILALCSDPLFGIRRMVTCESLPRVSHIWAILMV